MNSKLMVAIKTKTNTMVVALSGAVIIEQKGSRVKYKKKCEKCGYVDSATVDGQAPGKNTKTGSNFSCPKCRNNQKIVLQGT